MAVVGYLCVFLVVVQLISGKRINIATIVTGDDSKIFSIHRIAPAIEIAIDSIMANKTLLKGYSLKVRYADSQCDIAQGINQAFDIYLNRNVHVFLGPVCDFALAPVARQAKFWKLPLISPGAVASDFTDNKLKEYPMLTSAGPINLASITSFIEETLGYFNWSNVMLLYDRFGQDDLVPLFCGLTISAMHYIFKAKGVITQDYYKFDKTQAFGDMLKEEVGLDLSVVVLCASPDSVREIMLKAEELNFDNGEYVFFNIDLFSSKNDSERPWFRKNDTDDRNQRARKAYEALMTVTLRKPTSLAYQKFSDDVKKRAKAKDHNFTYGEDEVNSYVGAFHDAVILYALALNETLEANGNITDGVQITNRMWNRTFEGITGTVSIDANGDRNADYSLLDLNPKTNKFEVVANYYGNRKEYEPVEGRKIHWAGGRTSPPPDTPECGFDNSKCPPDKPFPAFGIVIIVLGSLLVLIVVGGFFIYRRIRLEAELAEMNWRVRWDDIMFGTMDKMKSGNAGSKLSLARKLSVDSDCSRDTIACNLGDVGHKQLFTKTGYFKGTIVAIKKIHRTSFSITKPLLLEIKKKKVPTATLR